MQFFKSFWLNLLIQSNRRWKLFIKNEMKNKIYKMKNFFIFQHNNNGEYEIWNTKYEIRNLDWILVV